MVLQPHVTPHVPRTTGAPMISCKQPVMTAASPATQEGTAANAAHPQPPHGLRGALGDILAEGGSTLGPCT